MNHRIKLAGGLLLASVGYSAAAPAAILDHCSYWNNLAMCDSNVRSGSEVTGPTRDQTVVPPLAETFRGPIAGALNFGPRGGNGGDSFGGRKGLSAGGDWERWGGWASYSHSDAEDDFAGTAFDGDLDVLMAGVDYTLNDKAVLGLAIGHEQNDMDTVFNAGNVQSDGFTLAPYFGYLFQDNISADLVVGYSWLDIEQYRIPAGVRINGNTDSNRWFVSGNVNGFLTRGNWVFTGRVGYLYANDDTDSFMETTGNVVPSQDITLSQGRLGVEAAYNAGQLEPFASVLYENDFSRDNIVLPAGAAQPANDDDGFVLGAGVRWFGYRGFSAVLEYTSMQGRSDLSNDTYSITGRLEF